MSRTRLRVRDRKRSRRLDATLLAFESMEARQVLSGCPLGYAIPGYLRAQAAGGVTSMATSGPTGYSPTQVRHSYGFDAASFGATAADGTGTTIAIVDAYDDPNIANDLHQFDVAFGLPDPPSFRKVNQTGGTTMPAANAGWASEIALDVEWAHAIAPGASILLVEANSNSFSDLLAAVNYARNQPGVVAVSMSWGGGEFSGETTYDSYFTTPSGHAGVSFFASSGDTGAPASYPSASPNVVSVGGTSLYLSSGNYSSESGWSGSGGGVSAYESQPSYQSGVVTQSTTKRATPDVAYDSDPNTGFPVYDSYNNTGTAKWSQFGGTSAAAPQWAALAAIVDQGRALAGLGSLDGRTQLLPALYGLAAGDFHDVTTGSSTGSPSYSAAAGYDLVTGRGTPVANLVIADLVAWGTTSTPTSPPTAPTSFTGTATSSSQVSLSWGPSTGADGYRLYLVSGSTATLLGSYSSTATSATVGGLSASTTYTFRLDAYNAAGTASATTQVTTQAATAIAAPTGVTVKVLSKTSVQVSWTASAGATGYKVLVSSGSTTSTVASVGASTTSVRVMNLSRGATYAFAVTAYNASSSATSGYVSVTMPASVPVTAPQNVAFKSTSSSGGTLSWTAADNATGYMVYAIDVSSRQRAAAWLDAATTSITVGGLRPGRSYQFQVVAMNDDSSAGSDVLTIAFASLGSDRQSSGQTGAGCGRDNARSRS
ncbi:MAG: fibronectin type III domain-containing protein [Planctomycetaceae bacterium]